MATIETKDAVKSLLDAALALRPAQRSELVERLLESLDPVEGTEAEIDAAWAAEAERRDRLIDEGKEEMIPGEEIVEKLLRGECP